MRIVCLGSEGFIGTHVRRRLLDHDVTRIDSLEPRVHREGTLHLAPCIRRHAGAASTFDLRGDVIIHLAAQVGVADSMQDPMRYVADNTADTARLMETIRKLPTRPRRIVVASSMSVYGDPRTEAPISEEHPIRPASVYGLTKYDQECLVALLGATMGIEVVALRFFNVYGPGQALHNPYTGVLANFANALLQGIAPTIYEDGLQTRDFIYVEDVARVVVAAALGEIPPGTYNVATGVASTVLDVARGLAEALQIDIPPDVTGITRAGDIRHCVGDATKLRGALPSWAPMPLSFGLVRYAAALTPGRPSTSRPKAPPAAAPLRLV